MSCCERAGSGMCLLFYILIGTAAVSPFPTRMRATARRGKSLRIRCPDRVVGSALAAGLVARWPAERSVVGSVGSAAKACNVKVVNIAHTRRSS